MNNQVIVPIAIIVLIGIIIALIFRNKKDQEKLEKKLNQDYPKKRLQDTDEGENQTI